MIKKNIFSPLLWPVMSFAMGIVIGTFLLYLPYSQKMPLSFVDSLFLATSALCVTGLSPVDISVQLSAFGQTVLICLVQLGGLGVTTYTSLVFVLLRARVPLTDRLAVSQTLANEHLKVSTVLLQIAGVTFAIQTFSACVLFVHDPVAFSPFSAVFHSISAFCNAGFSLFSNNMMGFQTDPVVNIIICANIILGGIGFAILLELRAFFKNLLCGRPARLGRVAKIIIRINLVLIVAGGGIIWIIEHFRPGNEASVGQDLQLAYISFFQAISARTAGFNTVSMPALCEASLFVIMLLMFIGGSSGSCAGGIKTGTMRVLVSYLVSQLRGERQILLGNRAVPAPLVSAALSLFFLHSLVIAVSVFLLCLTENVFCVQSTGEVRFISLLFEVVSAIGTVGLSLDLTALLSTPGKYIIIINMFAGRVGLFALLLAATHMHQRRPYAYPEAALPIG